MMSKVRLNPLVVVQNNKVVLMTAPLAEAARARNIALHDTSFASGVTDAIAPPYETFSPIFVYGSIAFLHHWARFHPNLSKWIFWDEDSLSPMTWARSFGDRFLNGGGFQVTASRAASLEDRVWHVRPIENNKRMTGGLYRPVDIVGLELEPWLNLWIADPREIVAEVRIFFVGKRIAAASMYRLKGEHFKTADHPLIGSALEAALEMAALYLPHPHTVMDLCLLPSGEWKLIEFNSINSSGWYACDPGAVLDAFVEQFRT